MESAGFIALSLQTALRRQMDVVANNIANLNTTGFKAEQVLFQEYVEEPDLPGVQTAEPISLVNDYGTIRNLAQGALLNTGNPLDVAIDGDGFLQVETPGGPRFSRGGALALDAEGRLVDGNGRAVLAAGGQPITVPPGSGAVSVDKDGFVIADGATLGQIELVRFERPQFLTPAGGGLFVTEEQPQPVEAGTTLRQGFLEQSNVNPILEVTRMIEVQRAYERTQRMIQGEHDRIRDAIGKLASLNGGA